MKRIAVALTLCCLSAGLLAAGPMPASAPTPAPVATTWQLDIEIGAPRAIVVQVPGEKAPQVFWYMPYTVSNHTGSDQFFVPEFTLYTNTGQILRAGQHVPPTVFQEIKKSLNEPLLKDDIAIAGRLLQGDDNAKKGVAIWPDFDPKAGAFDVFVGGLSGETAEIALPAPVKVTTIDAKGNKKTVTKESIIVSKALQLSYKVPGEVIARPQARIEQTAKEWVMR